MSLYDKASIALIPSGFKSTTGNLGKVYSVLPANGDGDFTHSRGSIATRVNKDGLIESVAIGEARLDYPLTNGLVGDCPYLLLEPSRTNLSEYSESFNNWSGGLATANQAISPDGNLTADKLTKTGSFSAQSESVTGTSGNNYVFSVFVKADTGTNITLRQASGSNDVRRYFQLSDETSGQSGGNQTGFVSEKIEKYPNGWYRVSTVCTANGTTISTNIYAGRAGSTTYDGNIFIWGSQVEEADYETSYIPNLSTGSTTRSQDFCYNSGTSADINSEEGVLFVEFAALNNDLTNRRISISNSTSSNLVRVGYDGTSNRIIAVIYNGSNQAVLLTTSYTITDFHKVAVKYKENDFALWVDGTEVATDSSGATFAADLLSELAFDNGASGNLFFGKVKQALVFNEALSDSELQQLTSKDENTKHKYSFGEAYCLVKQRKMKFERNGHTYKTHDSALTEWNSGGIENVPTHWLDVFKQNIDKELENRNLNTKEKKK